MCLSNFYFFDFEVSVQLFIPSLTESFDFLLFCFLSNLYILDVRPLSDVSLVNVSSHSVGFLFTSLIVSFSVQKLFSLMWSHLLIVDTISCTAAV